MNESLRNKTTVQDLRNKYIRTLNDSANKTECANKIANDLFALDLTVYSKNSSFESIIYNSFAKSILDDNISLHPEQMRIISHIEKNEASIISAPTSFGKTFCVFEYIARYEPKNIVLVVPTLALVDEYFKKIVKTYRVFFSKYKVYTVITENDKFDFNRNNIFILTHDRIVNESLYSKLLRIDFLVIDEVYKLETDFDNDRVLVLNMAYYYLAKKAKKYTLLAPFINGVLNAEKLDKVPAFIKSDFSPVVNDIEIREVLSNSDRFLVCKEILENIKEEKTLLYFPTVTEMYKYINEVISFENKINILSPDIEQFIQWAKEEIHEEWCVVKALERGYVIHNGQIPLGTRIYQLGLFEDNSMYNRMLCTSTLLEGVNTSAKNIIIIKPSRISMKDEDSFAAFDFYNLVGRTGRLYKHYIGNAYYIKGPNDPEYKKEEAVKDIRFEITDNSKDIDIQKGDIDKYKDVKDFLSELRIDVKEYKEEIGIKLRFDTVLKLHQRYKRYKNDLIVELKELCTNKKRGRIYLVKILYKICEESPNKIKENLITSLLNLNRPKLKRVIEDTRVYYKGIDINILISNAIKIKNSYLEHDFYAKVILIKYFLEKDGCLASCIKMLNEKILKTIEILYFLNSKEKKMLLDLGIYERDIDNILKIIGDKFSDSFELKKLLLDNTDKLNKITYLSKYVIWNLK